MKFFVPMQMPFVDKAHEDFFNEAIHTTNTAYPPNIAAIYLLSASRETRAHFWEMVDPDGNYIGDCNDWDDIHTYQLVDLAENLTCGSFDSGLCPCFLFYVEYRAILKAAIDYWYANTYIA